MSGPADKDLASNNSSQFRPEKKKQFETTKLPDFADKISGRHKSQDMTRESMWSRKHLEEFHVFSAVIGVCFA